MLEISIFISILFISLYKYCYSYYKINDIYCLMITGKEGREHFVPKAILNFLDQSEFHKKLIVINHGKKSIIELSPLADNFRIKEIKTDQSLNLGQLKNLGLSYIPEGCLFCPWDDDDIRDRHFLKFLRSRLRFPYSAVFLNNRYEYNSNNGFCYRSFFRDGMPVFLGFKNKNWKYLERDTLEDVSLQKDLISLGKIYQKIDNPSLFYIRIIHDNNTSPYVNKNRKEIRIYTENNPYQEFSVSESEKKKIISIFKHH